MAMSTVEERIEILKAEHQRLEQYLYTLSPEDWHHPSTCDQWTVADVIAHLIVATEATPPGLPRPCRPRVSRQSVCRVAQTNVSMRTAMAQRVIALRQELGSHLLSAFVTTNRAFAHAFAQVAPDDWEKLCYRPNGAEPIRTILDNFIAEVGVHRWDVTVSL